MKAAAKICFKPHKAHVGIEMFPGILVQVWKKERKTTKPEIILRAVNPGKSEISFKTIVRFS